MVLFFILSGTAVLVAGLFYLLYQRGYAVFNLRAALLYMGYPRWGKRKNCIQARFVACTGFTRQVIRLLPSKQYRLIFSSHITKGTVSAEIYEDPKAPPVTLDAEHPSVIISADTQKCFRVVTRFRKADGCYRLIWNETE